MTIDLKDRLYTSSEVAEILGVSLRSVYRYLEEGKLDADIKTATGRHRFSKKNILDFLQPGGITKDQAENQFSGNNNINEKEEFDVLDLPAINKTNKLKEESYDDFSFDLDEDFFKSLDLENSSSADKKPNDSFTNDNNTNSHLNFNNSSKVTNGDFIDDDLEKLLREFEEKEGISDSSEKPVNDTISNKPKSNYFENDDSDFDLDSFFKELEDESNTQNIQSTPKVNNEERNKPEPKNDDFDFDFDFDFLNDFNTEDEAKTKPSPSSKPLNSFTEDKVDSDDEEDNWLERFRKAAQNNNNQTATQNNQDKLKDSFFDNSSIDHFFDNAVDSLSSIGSNYSNSSQAQVEKVRGNKEYYFTSSLNGLKEIAQNVDRVAKKFDTDYAFTMNAGLSLHKPISPFTLIHTYVRGRDLELFEDYLNLTEVSNPEEASVCLIVPGDVAVFEDSYELHGLYVVSNVQLRSDLIDKGLDKLAREI
jgi:excisionase family DNA binding protein